MKKRDRILKGLFAIAILFIMYLIALGLRYERLNDSAVIDKWHRQVYLGNTKELPIKANGERHEDRRF